MSETSPLTAGGFALPPTSPDAPEPDDDWLLQDFLAARALAPHLGIAARLDAFAAAHGAADDPSADDATQAATQPNGGIIVRLVPPTDDGLGATSSGAGPSQPPPPPPPPSPPAQPPIPYTRSQDLSPPAAPAPAFPVFAPEPDVALDDWDAMPLGLKLQRFGEGLAPATPDTAHLSPLGRVLQALGQGAADGWGPEPLSVSPDTELASKHAGILANAAPGPGGPLQFLDSASILPPDNVAGPNRLGARDGSLPHDHLGPTDPVGMAGRNYLSPHVEADPLNQTGRSGLDQARSDTGNSNPPSQLAQEEPDGETRGGRAGETGAFYDAFVTARYGAIYNNLRQVQPDNYVLSAPSLRAGAPTAAEVSELDFAYRIAVQTQPLANRAAEVLRNLSDTRAENHRAVAVLRTTDGTFTAGSGRPGLQRPQRDSLTAGETPVPTQGLHAEINALSFARGRPLYIGTSRDFCSQCVEQITHAGGVITSPRTAYFPLNVSSPP
jgi:hypothetical protein